MIFCQQIFVDIVTIHCVCIVASTPALISTVSFWRDKQWMLHHIANCHCLLFRSVDYHNLLCQSVDYHSLLCQSVDSHNLWCQSVDSQNSLCQSVDSQNLWQILKCRQDHGRAIMMFKIMNSEIDIVPADGTYNPNVRPSQWPQHALNFPHTRTNVRLYSLFPMTISIRRRLLRQSVDYHKLLCQSVDYHC